MSFDVAALADHVVIDPEDGEHRLGDRWKDAPRVLLFLRHFG